MTVAVAASVLGAASQAKSADLTTNALATGPAGGATAGAAPVAGPTDPVLNLLLEKGMITEDEAEKTQAEADAMRTNMAALYAAENSKWKISKNIKDLELFGDLRLRYEDREEADPDDRSGSGKKATDSKGRINLDRFRYALRFGVRGDLFDDYYFGFRLETSSNPRSSWVTMGSSSPDPYGKSQSGVDVGQLYIGWQPESWFDFTVGKMPNPLYTSSMVWSPSINPEGLAEHLKYSVGEVDFFGNLAQFLYQDMNPVTASPNLGFGNFAVNQNNIFQLAWQGGFDYHFTKDMDLKVGATIYQYLGMQNSTVNDPESPGFGDTYIGESPYAGPNATYPSSFGNQIYYGASGYSPGTVFQFSSTKGKQTTYYSSLGYPLNQVGLDHLSVLEIPAEFNVKLFKTLNLKAFGDFAYNLDGHERAVAAAQGYKAWLNYTVGDPKLAFAPQVSDVKAYQFGLAIGNKDSLGLVNGTTSKKNAWELRSYWQHIEQYALDPNLLDLDYNAGAENLQGIFFAFAYSFSDNIFATVRYGHASRINNQLGTGGTGTDIPQINPIKSFDLFQADLTYKF